MTALELTAPQKAQLRAAIAAAFNPGTFDLMTADHLGQNVFMMSGAGEFPVVIAAVIGWCEDRGYLGKLVHGLVVERPDNPEVIRFARGLGLHPVTQPKAAFEAFVGANRQFHDANAWFHQGYLTGTRVCQVRRDSKAIGTGFLVGPDAILTNWHVMQYADKAEGGAAAYEFVFGFARTDDGTVIAEGDAFAPAGTWHLASAARGDAEAPTDEELDFALVKLDKPAGGVAVASAANGTLRRWIDLPRTPYAYADRPGLAILGHPLVAGSLRNPLRLALDATEKAVENGRKNRVRYSVPTLRGSSGSPVFDLETWTLIALHHVGFESNFNQGVPIWRIATHPGVRAYVDAIE